MLTSRHLIPSLAIAVPSVLMHYHSSRSGVRPLKFFVSKSEYYTGLADYLRATSWYVEQSDILVLLVLMLYFSVSRGLTPCGICNQTVD